MKIAIPTNDGSTVSSHFGRSSAFLVFETGEGAVVNRELRPNAGCGDHTHGQKEHEHNHNGIVAVLHDCDAVLCGGIGQGALLALEAAGIRTILRGCSGTASEAVEAYLRGTLSSGGSLCQCH